MPLEKIIIKVSGETDLASTISQLEKIGVVDKKNADSFKATSVTAKKSFSDIDKATVDTQKNMKGLGGAIDAIGPAMMAAFSVGALISFQKAIIDITAKFQKYEAVLTNTLGSNSAAKKVLQDIQDFASKTPFSVDELTASFVKLANQGFTPNTVQLRQLGDLASSTGKSFDQLTEAILDAQTGQFERLKEFGIKASKQGDLVTFAFKGVKTTVDFTSASIQKYILGLGDLKGVTGSMAAISGTLEGQLSNLGDTFDQLLLAIGKGESGGISKAISGLSVILGELTKAASGQSSVFDGYINAVKAAIDPFVDFISTIGELLSKIGLIENGGSVIKGIFNVIGVAVQIATLPLKLFIQSIVTMIDLVSLNFTKVGEDFKKLGNTITLGFFKAEEKITEATKKGAEDRTAIAEEESKKKVGLIKALSDELKRLKQQEEDALTIEEIRGIQIRAAKVKAELDRLHGVDNKDEKKRLKDALDLYAQDAKDRADIEANARQLIRDEKNKEYADDVKFYEALSTLSHEQKQNELHAEYEFYKNLSDQDKKAVEQRKANQQQLQQFLVSSLTQIASQINQNIQARRQAEISNIQLTEQADLDSLDRRAAAENLTATQIAAQRKIIQEKALKEQKQAQAKAAKANKDLAYFNIAINTAQAITKQLATTPYPAALPFLALIAAEAAVQVGLVASRPIPAFAKGVVDYNGKGTGTSDSNIVAISRGESIIKASETARYKEELEMMNKGKFADFVYKKYITPAIVSDSIADARSKGMAQNIATSLQVNELNTDHLERAIKGNKKVKIENLGELAAIMQRQDHFAKYKF